MSLPEKLVLLGQGLKLSLPSSQSLNERKELEDVTLTKLSRHQSIYPQTEKTAKADIAFKNLIEYIDEWYHDIDVEALRIALASVVGHRNRKEVPVWLFVLGSSGTGKSIIPELVAALPNTHRINSMTANTLLSGLPKAKGGSSLLLEIGTKDDRSGILIFPDFTTTIARRDDTVKVIAGDLREVYDGHLFKHTGSGKPLNWEGKVTIIAMATPEIERQWGAMRGLGERFVQVRWGRTDGIKQATKAYTQIGHEGDIKKKIRELASIFVSNLSNIFPTALDPIANGVAHISEITSILRASVERDERSKKLVDVGQPEGNTRFFKAIVQIARGHAALFNRDMVIEDYKLASRVAIDSIPPVRLRIVKEVGSICLTQVELLTACSDKPKTTVLRALEELEYLKVLNVDRENGDSITIELSDKFRKLKEGAGRLWV